MRANKYIQEAIHAEVVKRALRVAIIVGVLLNIINQGEAIFSNFKEIQLGQFILTFLVPYFVSTYSSVLSQLSKQGE